MEFSYQKAQKTCQSARFGYFVEQHGETCNISPMESALSDDGSEEDEDTNEVDSEEETQEPRKKFAFPELDARIRGAIKDYGAVFPKLNFSSPRVCTLVHAYVQLPDLSLRMQLGCFNRRIH